MIKLKTIAGPRKNAPQMKKPKKEYEILELLKKNKNLNGTNIARSLKKDTGNIYAILRDMEKRNLIRSVEAKDPNGKPRSCKRRSRTYELNEKHPRNKQKTTRIK